jgi:hypothetical protein
MGLDAWIVMRQYVGYYGDKKRIKSKDFNKILRIPRGCDVCGVNINLMYYRNNYILDDIMLEYNDSSSSIYISDLEEVLGKLQSLLIDMRTGKGDNYFNYNEVRNVEKLVKMSGVNMPENYSEFLEKYIETEQTIKDFKRMIKVIKKYKLDNNCLVDFYYETSK